MGAPDKPDKVGDRMMACLSMGKGLTWAQKAVLAVIAHFDGPGGAHPTRETLAGILGISRDSVGVHIEALEAKGGLAKRRGQRGAHFTINYGWTAAQMAGIPRHQKRRSDGGKSPVQMAEKPRQEPESTGRGAGSAGVATPAEAEPASTRQLGESESVAARERDGSGRSRLGGAPSAAVHARDVKAREPRQPCLMLPINGGKSATSREPALRAFLGRNTNERSSARREWRWQNGLCTNCGRSLDPDRDEDFDNPGELYAWCERCRKRNRRAATRRAAR